MAASIVDIQYSVEKWFNDTWSATSIAFQNAEFDPDTDTNWIAPMVLYVSGLPSRADDYSARLLVSINIFSRTSGRKVVEYAQQLEELLRAHTVTLYDEDDGSTELGAVRFMEPEFKALRKHDNLHTGTLDVVGIVHI